MSYPNDPHGFDYPARVADEYVACPDINDPQAFAARVVGESMLPDYPEGSVVVFSPAAKIADGADCFVKFAHEDAQTFKRVFFNPDQTVRLQPLNPKFPSREVRRVDVAGMYRAAYVIRKLIV
jgi:phage repressor protein C with HTH and peptisase S24 domain